MGCVTPNALRCRCNGRRPQFRDHPQNVCKEIFGNGVSPQTSRCLVALCQGWRHSGGGEDEDGIRRVSTSLQFQSTAGGRRRKPRTHEGAVVKNGPAARNSFSRMLGSWFWDRKIPPDTRLAGSASCLTNRSSPRQEFVS